MLKKIPIQLGLLFLLCAWRVATPIGNPTNETPLAEAPKASKANDAKHEYLLAYAYQKEAPLIARDHLRQFFDLVPFVHDQELIRRAKLLQASLDPLAARQNQDTAFSSLGDKPSEQFSANENQSDPIPKEFSPKNKFQTSHPPHRKRSSRGKRRGFSRDSLSSQEL